MRKLRIIAAVGLCKLARFFLRLLRRGGTNFPGKLALQIYPDLLGVLGQSVYTIVISGTNGKTTSARMLEQCLENAAIPAFSNRSGANLLSGITAAFVANADWTGKMKTKHAIIECDEAAFRQVSKYLDAKIVLVTNVFRDQLDRFGEITHTINSLRAGLEHSPHATICLNADCALTVSLARGLDNPIRYFGVETALYQDGENGVSEAVRCLDCGHEYTYAYKTYGHLGAYHCARCGYRRPEAQVAVTQILEETPDTTRVEVRAEEGSRQLTINLPGAYNVYNAAGVIAVAELMRLGLSVTAVALAEFRAGFGRMEKLRLGDAPLRIILVKNPIGLSQALRYLTAREEPVALALCLTDKAADGTDISWIWDAEADGLAAMEERLTVVYCSGNRADELAVWLKYCQVDEGKIHVEPDYDKLLQTLRDSPAPVYILPTYTAMLLLREKLVKQYGLSQFWE